MNALVHSNTAARDYGKGNSAKELDMWNRPHPTGEAEQQSLTRVRVWFGPHVIADYQASPHMAARYEQAMRRRFAGLRVTCDEALAAADPDSSTRPLPNERLWEMTP
jgi:hypothetical protein